VMTGFRVALGGAQSLWGIEPDITTLGKIVGGGLPLGAYGGKAAWMDQVLPAGKVFQAGTLSGNPLATAAGLETIRILIEESPYEMLESRGRRLGEGLSQAATQAGIAHQLQRVGSMMTLFFNDYPVTNWTQADRSDRSRYADFFWGMIHQGHYFPCSQFEALFFSIQHEPEMIEETIEAAGRTLQWMAEGIRLRP
jgi:glutamate-1-semialdehyde 2,1-aminomutase